MKLAICFTLAAALAAAADPNPVNTVVFQQAGRFGGWPANHGIWSWGDEILVGFEVGYFQAKEKGHNIDYSKPAEHVLARSLDGGQTWSIEKPEGLRPPPGEKVAGVPTGESGKPVHDCAGGLDFSNPNFILTARMTSINDGESRYYYSSDKGHTWDGPCRLPNFGQPGIAARTDYLINGKHDMMLFLTAAKTNRKEGRVICVRTQDGGKTWKFVSFVKPEPDESDYAIMPATVRLDAKTLFSAVRYRKFIDSFESKDNGATWARVGRPAPDTGGNPPSLLKLRDNRLALIYGRRLEPFGIRARISTDKGHTWSDEIVLRQDGGTWDLGYVRSAQRKDGKVVSVYYYNTKEHPERFIGATIWQP